MFCTAHGRMPPVAQFGKSFLSLAAAKSIFVVCKFDTRTTNNYLRILLFIFDHHLYEFFKDFVKD